MKKTIITIPDENTGEGKEINLDNIIIDEKLATNRIAKFQEKQIAFKNSMHVDQHSLINYNPLEFSKLLKAASGNGLRIYFAAKDDNKYQLDVVFALTDGNANDIGKYYTVDPNLKPILQKDASAMVEIFKTKMCDKFRTNNKYKNETESIYYNIDDPNQLIKILNENGANSFEVHFAVYLDNDDATANDDDKKYTNQLALIFKINSNTFRDFYVVLTSVNRYADTGVPCAPPPKCPGTSL